MNISTALGNAIRISGLAILTCGLALGPIGAQELVTGLVGASVSSLSRIDTDGDGLADVVDNCREIPNRGARSCDSDRDGFGNVCDGDFDQNGSIDSADFMQIFLEDFKTGVDSGRGTDMDCNGVVDASDFTAHFIGSFVRGLPGPRSRPVESTVVEEKSRNLGGRDYVFQKHRGADGDSWEVVLDAGGLVVDPSSLPQARHSVVSAELAQLLDQIEGGEIRRDRLRVTVATEFPVRPGSELPEVGSVEVASGVVVTGFLNNRPVSLAELDAHEAERQLLQREGAAQRNQERQNLMRAWALRHGLENQVGLQWALEGTSTNVVLDLSPEQINALALARDGVVRGIQVYEEPEHEVAQAIVATNVKDYALPYADTRGKGMGVYMTEEGCPASTEFSNYENRDGTGQSEHASNVGGIIRGVSPDSFIYCRGESELPTGEDLFGALLNELLGFDFFDALAGPEIQAVTMSMKLKGGTKYETEDRDWDNFIYENEIPAFKSAGNQGLGKVGEVTSPGKGLNVITVGNYDDSDDTIAPKSSFTDPDTGNEKPEIVAPGEKILAGGFTKSGTSMASPHAAGFAADMLSKYSWLRFRPSLVKANLLSGATDSIAGGADAVGLGGIDFLSAAYNGHNVWWEGSNSAFESWDAAGGSLDGFVDFKLYISQSWGSVRAVLSWLTRGSFTFEHTEDAHAIGMDLDLRVLDPNGELIDFSDSWDNNFEDVEFDPTVSGTYTFRISRFSNADPANKLRMGLAIDYFND